jgi:hypothetical protein
MLKCMVGLHMFTWSRLPGCEREPGIDSGRKRVATNNPRIFDGDRLRDLIHIQQFQRHFALLTFICSISISHIGSFNHTEMNFLSF